MVKAIQFHRTGGPEVLQWEEVTIGDPGPGEIRVKHTAIGLNYIDTYHRTGLYPLPLPHGIGMEGEMTGPHPFVMRRPAITGPSSLRTRICTGTGEDISSGTSPVTVVISLNRFSSASHAAP